MSQLGISLPDRYRMEGPVASGGMAAVYAAHDTLLDRPVAVKVLAEHLNEDVAARERFQREARAAANLSSHPGVVTIFDVGEHAGRSFIVMELFRGGTLADVLRTGERPEIAQSIRWLERAAEALDLAHERGIVHRDIKPANLLLDERGNLAVADFGIARLAWEDAVTQTGQILGTAAYLSPEQAEGGTATAASDRYALACVAYELITGARPFDGEHFAAQARAHIEDEPTPPTVRDPSLPKAADAVFARGLAKDPAERWPTAVEFVRALEAALEGPEPTATDATQVMTGGRFTSAAPRRTVSAPPLPRHRPMRLPLVLAAALALAALVAVVIAASRGDDPPPEQLSTPPAETAEPADEKRKNEEEAKSTPEATAETQEPAAEDKPAGTPQQLDAQGFALLQQGKYDQAIPYFQAAIDQCGSSAAPYCGYALYNMGTALNRSGRPAEAIPFLQERLERFPGDRPEIVREELASACEAAGQECDLGGNGNGKGKGKKKDKD